MTATGANPTGHEIGMIPLQPLYAWSSLGLAFSADGTLLALLQPTSSGPAGPPAQLLVVDPATASVVSSTITNKRFGDVGGLAFAGGHLYFADRDLPSSGQSQLYEINQSTGSATALGPTNIATGVHALIGCTPPPKICLPPPPDMDAWYPMDGDGTDLILGKNATISGAVGFPPGVVAQAADFQGGYMSVPSGPVLNEGKGDFSIDAWANAAFGSSSTFYILDKRTLGTSVRGWSLMVLNGHLLLQLADGSYGNYIDNRVIPPLAWRHLAVTVDRDNPQGIVFYIDGVPGTPLDPTSHQNSLDNTSATYFGRHANGGVSTAIGLDEVEMFDRALAPGEVASIYNAGHAGKCK
jgi:hypothetical protein